jgi:arylsulfatase A-like enzyme
MVPPGPCSSLRRIHRTTVWAPICLGGALGLWGAWGELEAQAYLQLSFHRLGLRVAVAELTRGLGIGFLVALALLALGALWRWRLAIWMAGTIRIEVLQSGRAALWLRRLALIGAVVLVWWLNRELLPAHYARVRLAVDLTAFLLVLALALDRNPKTLSLRSLAAGWKSLGIAVLALVAAGNGAVWADRVINRPDGPNVLLISIDTLRSDALGLYGGPPGISPAIDALAQDGLDFRSVMAPSPWTLPSHISLLTSLYPNEHGLDTPRAWSHAVRLDPWAVTLAEVLSNENYATLAITDGGFVSSVFGFGDGFERYVEKGSGERKVHLARRWIRSVDRPFFLFFHTYAVHAPYRETWYLREIADQVGVPLETIDLLDARLSEAASSPGKMEEILAGLGLLRADVCKALYLGGVREADRMIARLLEALNDSGKRGKSLIVVTSDLGEEFGEHNAEAFFDAHQQSLFEVTLNVPLIITGSGLDAASIDTPVSLVDVAPTILSYLGLPPVDTWRGRDLASLGESDADGMRRPLFAQTNMSDQLLAVRRGNRKLIENRSCTWLPCEESKLLFDLAADPAESSDLFKLEQGTATDLEKLIDAYARGAAPEAPRTEKADGPDEDLRRQLKALGYLE